MFAFRKEGSDEKCVSQSAVHGGHKLVGESFPQGQRLCLLAGSPSWLAFREQCPGELISMTSI